MTQPECPSCHAPLPEQQGRFCNSCGNDLTVRDSVFEPLFRPGPPPAAWPSAGGHGQSAPPGYGDNAAPGYGETGAPGYGETAALDYGETAAPGFGETAAPGYGEPPAAGYGQTAALDYGDMSYGYADAPGYAGPAGPGGWSPPAGPPSAGLPPAGSPSPGSPSPGPLSRPPGPGQGQRPAGPRRSRAKLITAVIVVIVLLGGGYLLFGHGHSGSPRSGSNTPTAAGGGKSSGKPKSGAESAQLARLSGLLQQSHAARSRVVRATAGVGNCSMAPAAGVGLMNQSIRQRQKVLGELKTVPVSSIPGGRSMAAELQQVLRHSVDADRDFVGWMQQIQPSRHCRLNTRKSAPYQAGLTASARANSAKTAFLAHWNPLARKFGQPTYTAFTI
jgi:hypothetical protein